MKRWKTVAGVALVFLLGAGVGTLATAVYLKHTHPLFRRDAATRAAYVMKKLSAALELTDEQKAVIRPLVEKRQAEVHAVFRTHRARLKRLLEEGVSEMKRDLTPEQQRTLDEMVTAYKKKRQSGRRSNP